MIVTCEQCQARFKLADEKVKTEGTKVRCSKCQSIFTVFPPVPAEPAEASPRPVVAEATEPERPSMAPEQTAAEPLPETTATESSAAGLEFDFSEQGQAATGDEEAGAFTFDSPAADDDRAAGGFDFDSAFSEEESAPAFSQQSDERPVEFDFGATDDTGEAPADSPAMVAEEFDFSASMQEKGPSEEFAFDEEETAAATAGGFDFAAEAVEPESEDEAGPQGFDFSTENGGFGEISFDEEETDDFSLGDQPGGESSDFGQETNAWGTPGGGELDSFDFEEPKFDTPLAEAGTSTESLSFGEIDFSDDDEGAGALPSFDSPPAFGEPPAQPSEPVVATLPPETAAPPVPPRQPVSRPHSEPQIPAPPLPRRSPASRMVVVLVALLLVLCGAGGYLYMSGDGERLVNQAIMKIKGEKPAGPVVQLISFSNIATSYVNNREAGQLLVVQGTVTNNFPTSRSAIAVKGLLLDGAGKIVQHQTVYCGNYLSEEKLRTLKYAAIEEAMGNQFGESFSNMNVKPEASLKFTIVFRNVPAEIANINFEPVDSKPGSN